MSPAVNMGSPGASGQRPAMNDAGGLMSPSCRHQDRDGLPGPDEKETAEGASYKVPRGDLHGTREELHSLDPGSGRSSMKPFQGVPST